MIPCTPFRIAALFLMAAGPLVADESAPATDLLRFTNGNQIDGRFTGMNGDGVITWTRTDVAAPMEFQREKIRQLVLRNARPVSAMDDPCHVTLVNGDRIPGRVTAADADTVTLETTVAGTMMLPRNAVAAIAPNPFGGKLIYAGPFDRDGWKVVHAEDESGEPDPFAGNLRAGLKMPGTATDEEDADRPVWIHGGASWISRGGADALSLDAGLPDRALIRFKLSWRSRPSISLAFHADPTPPQVAEKEPAEGEEKPEAPRINFGSSRHLPALFGTAYVLNFQSGYVNLQRCGYNDRGEPEVERVRVGSNSVRLPDTGEAEFEVRCDRREGLITVHLNGEFVVQWNTGSEGAKELGEPVPYAGTGGGIGFLVHPGNSPVRFSDIILAEWNGMTDSARSMENDRRDIALLVNGTDRFSGSLTSIRDGFAEMDAAYGPLKVPLEDIAEIHFAREDRRKPSEAAVSEVAVHLQPVGRVSGVPLSSDGRRLQLESSLVGKIDMDLKPAVIVGFQNGDSEFDLWDAEDVKADP